MIQRNVKSSFENDLEINEFNEETNSFLNRSHSLLSHESDVFDSYVDPNEISYRICSPSELTQTEIERWNEIQQAVPYLDSPFFRPEYTVLVSSLRKDMDIVIIEKGNRLVGFFPFHRDPYNVGRPVGVPMNDFQGIVLEQGVDIDESELLNAASLKSWKFDHGIATQLSLFRNGHSRCGSAFLDLSNGFEAYKTERREAGSKIIKQTLRKKRQLIRKMGPLRFEAHTTDPAVFETLIQWKKEQYIRTGKTDTFKFKWPLELLEQVLSSRSDAFKGRLSALYAGDTLLAVDLGVQSFGVLNSWFPAYNTDYRSFSPGHVLLLEIAQASEELGISRIDLGKGDEEYKVRYASGMLRMCEGGFDSGNISRVLHKQWYRTRDWAKTSRFKAFLKYSARLLRPFRDRFQYGEQTENNS